MGTFDALIDTLLPEWPALPAPQRAAVSDHCAGFVRRQIALAPAHIRFGIRALLSVFCMLALVRFGLRPFGALSSEQRGSALRMMEYVPPLAALEMVLRSMTVVAFIDHPLVVRATGDSAAARPAVP